MLWKFLTILLLVALAGCARTPARPVEARALVGQWILPEGEGFVEFGDHGLFGMVSHSRAAMGNYTCSQEGGSVGVRYTDKTRQRIQLKWVGKALQLTFPHRSPLLCQRSVPRMDLLGEEIVGQWQAHGDDHSSLLEFHPDGVYIFSLWVPRRSERRPVPYIVEEVGTYTLQPGGKLAMVGYRASFQPKDDEPRKCERSIEYHVKQRELELTWHPWEGKRAVLRKFQPAP